MIKLQNITRRITRYFIVIKSTVKYIQESNDGKKNT